VGLTLDAAAMGARSPGLRLLAVRAGLIPTAVSSVDRISDPEIRAYATREGIPPNIWVSLGHDAAALARRAVAALPLDSTSDPAEVAKRRAAVKDALAKASVHLWTTTAQSFNGARILPRELGTVELPALEKRR
jgi:hypothetical protein